MKNYKILDMFALEENKLFKKIFRVYLFIGDTIIFAFYYIYLCNFIFGYSFNAV